MVFLDGEFGMEYPVGVNMEAYVGQTAAASDQFFCKTREKPVYNKPADVQLISGHLIFSNHLKVYGQHGKAHFKSIIFDIHSSSLVGQFIITLMEDSKFSCFLITNKASCMSSTATTLPNTPQKSWDSYLGLSQDVLYDRNYITTSWIPEVVIWLGV